MRCPPPLLRLRSAGRGWRGRHRFRRRLSTMASEAGHINFALGLRELGVDVMRHGDHGTSHEFLGIIVAGVVPTNVAELAILSERSSELLHDASLQLFGRQYLQVLRRAASAAFPLLRGGVLGAERNQN